MKEKEYTLKLGANTLKALQCAFGYYALDKIPMGLNNAENVISDMHFAFFQILEGILLDNGSTKKILDFQRNFNTEHFNEQTKKTTSH